MVFNKHNVPSIYFIGQNNLDNELGYLNNFRGRYRLGNYLCLIRFLFCNASSKRFAVDDRTNFKID